MDEAGRLLEQLESADLPALREEMHLAQEESLRSWSGPVHRYRPSVEEPPDVEIDD